MFYQLVLIDTDLGHDRSRWTLNLPTTIGRNPDHGIIINHDSVSRTHCRLSLDGEGSLVVRDLNSMNGTYFNDQKIQQTRLMAGDQFQIGALTLRVEMTSDSVDNRLLEPPNEFDLSETTPMRLAELHARAKAGEAKPNN